MLQVGDYVVTRGGNRKLHRVLACKQVTFHKRLGRLNYNQIIFVMNCANKMVFQISTHWLRFVRRGKLSSDDMIAFEVTFKDNTQDFLFYHKDLVEYSHLEHFLPDNVCSWRLLSCT